MIALIAMVALVSSYLLSTVLTRTSTEVKLDNDQRTRQAMLEAKAALIAYAASQAWNSNDPLHPENDQPGALPCPSPNEDGTSASSCETEATRIGRFPWKTVGGQKPYDGSGNVLWYALSSEFRKKADSTIINSDTVGSLTVTGATPATGLVAVIIAPGPPVSGQTRSTSSAVGTYLESSNANIGDADTFVTANTSSDTFNDQIMFVTQADLMAVVEPAVAARIERDIKPYLATFASQWGGAYPFPASFPQGSNAQDSYSGSSSAQEGLLPLTPSASYSWTNGSGAVALVGGTAGSVSGVSCARYLTTYWRCSFTINGVDLGNNSANWGPCTDAGGTRYRYCIVSPVLRIQGAVNTNAGRTLSELPDATEVRSNRTPIISPSISGTLSSTGAGTITYQATYGYSRYRGSFVTRTIRFDIPIITTSPATSSTDANAGWFIKQQWYRQTYYAVAPGYLPGGGGSCAAGSTCLTINNLPSATYATTNDKHAILVFMGYTLNGSPRPSSTLGNYLEGQNASTSDRTFAHRSGSITSANDRVVVLAP